MTTKRVTLIAAALALLTVIALLIAIFTIPKQGVSAYSTDKRMKIDDVRYFPGTNVDYSYLAPKRKLKFYCQQLANKLGIKYRPWQRDPVRPLTMSGKGPRIVMHGHIEDGDVAAFVLLSETGERVNPSVGVFQTARHETYQFLWNCYLYDDAGVTYPLTNGLYRVRHFGQTNDLAIIRVRQ